MGDEVTDPADPVGDRRPALRVVGPDEGAGPARSTDPDAAPTAPEAPVAVVDPPAAHATAPDEHRAGESNPGSGPRPAPDSAPDRADTFDPDDGGGGGGSDGDDGGGDDRDRDGGDDRDDRDGGDDRDDGDDEGERDWAWVGEWRESDEPPPWATGLPLAAFAAVLAGVAIWVLSAGLAEQPLLAVVLNLLVAGGLAPAMWLSRNLPVLRWFAAGAAVGVVAGWVAALMML